MKTFYLIFLIGTIFSSILNVYGQMESDGVDIESPEDENILPSLNSNDIPVSDSISEFDLSNIGKHVHSNILFTEPYALSLKELPTNFPIKVLVSFLNDGSSVSALHVDSMEASVRYPQDLTFYIQNYTDKWYGGQLLPIGKRATFDYTFRVSEQLAGRPFTLILLIKFRDFNSTLYQTTVYNQTLMFTELESGLDGQTFFLYLFLAACAVLLVVVSQQFVTGWGKKKIMLSPSSKQNASPLELGTQTSGVDVDWLPQDMLNQLNKATKRPNAPNTGGTKK